MDIHTGDQTTNQRSRMGKMAGFTGALCNLLLSVLKIIIGELASSTSIVADGLNNLADAASSIVTWIGFKLAERPADKEHPYGHARFEYLAGLALSAMILVAGLELAKTSIVKILHPVAITYSGRMAAVLLFSMAVKLWMMLFYKKIASRIQSKTLLAAAADSRNDVLTTGAVFATTMIEHASGLRIDGYMGFLVSVFILTSGISLAKDTISPLLGEGVHTELRQQLETYISANPLVLGCHDLMVHDYGPGEQYASIHVEIDKDVDIMTAHEAIDRMECGCMERYGVHMVMHYDPVITDNEEINRLRSLVEETLAKIDDGLSVHDFRVHFHDEQTELVFDMVVPDTLREQQESILLKLREALMHADKKEYKFKVTFDLEAGD